MKARQVRCRVGSTGAHGRKRGIQTDFILKLPYRLLVVGAVHGDLAYIVTERNVGVSIKDAGGAVASDINVGPAVIVKVQRGCCKTIVSQRLRNLRCPGYLFKSVVSAIV